jgi:hypothetical protein
MMNMEGANEADVRAEIADPLLAALGYKRGTPNDIARELALRYAREFLGRKKPTDPPLRGRADYVMTVTGAGRWTLETKPATEDIDIDAIEQALTYAHHPEVAASYAVITNGRRLTVHHTLKPATDPPLIEVQVSNPNAVAEELRKVLSPAAIRRDCTPRPVDLGKPLADGLRSRAEIQGGEIRHEEYRWTCNMPFPPAAVSQLDEGARRLRGYRISVTGGSVWRDDQSRIRAKLTWSQPHDELLRFAIDKKLMDVEYIALADHISADPDAPTVFDVVGEVEVKERETLFNLVQWDTMVAGLPMKGRYTGRATGYIKNDVFQGTFDTHQYYDFPSLPSLRLEAEIEGTFQIKVDPR